MSDSYVGELRMFGGNFAPTGWAFCDGQLLSIGEHDALFSLVGTTYGGDGQSTFALPDLRGRTPVHRSGPLPQGTSVGLAAGPATSALQSPPGLTVNFIISLYGIYPSHT